MKTVSIVDKEGFWLRNSIFEDSLIGDRLEKGEKIVPLNESSFRKPLYKNEEWIEGATKEESSVAFQSKPDFDLLFTMKKNEVKCGNEAAYNQGVTLSTSLGEKTFSLTSQDQMNITGLQSKMLLGDPSVANGVPYHANGEFCTWWSHEDFTLIATKASEFVFYHTSYINFLNRYIEQIDTVEELENVYYGMELPKELAESFTNFMKGGVA